MHHIMCKSLLRLFAGLTLCQNFLLCTKPANLVKAMAWLRIQRRCVRQSRCTCCWHSARSSRPLAGRIARQCRAAQRPRARSASYQWRTASYSGCRPLVPAQLQPSCALGGRKIYANAPAKPHGYTTPSECMCHSTRQGEPLWQKKPAQAIAGPLVPKHSTRAR
jgi:hypothetical protein